jgi:glycosyltransferase involved in cell wall biosynthesis
MQILHLQTELKLSCGVTRVIGQLMKNASADSAHFALCFGGNAVEKFRSDRLPVTILPSRFGKLSILSHTLFIRQFCTENNITLLHAHHRYFDIVGSIVSRITGIPIVTSVHSKVNSFRLFSYKAERFITVCDAMKKHLTRNFHISPARITVINNFIDENEYSRVSAVSENLKQSLGIPEQSTVLVFVGRLSKEKGIDTLLRAFKRLQTEYFGLKLLIIGDGEEKGLVQEFVHSAEKNIIYVNPVDDISPYYQIADIIVLPSRIDPFPLVMLEAGLFERPLVTTEVDGIAEFIKNGFTGIFTQPGNTESLAEGIAKLLDNAAFRQEIAGRLHRKVMSTSRKDQLLPKYYALYAALSK